MLNVFFLRLIIAVDLGTVSLKAGSRGYFQGAYLKDEHLAVALTSKVGDAEPLYAGGSERLFPHWSWVRGTSTKTLMPWVAVKGGFGAALEGEGISRHELSDWVVDGRTLQVSDDGVANVCCIEQTAAPNASVYLLFLYGENVGVGKVQTVAPEAQLSNRVDGLKPTEALKAKRVAIVGVGSGGSMTAVNMAAAGVGTLHLFDKDVLSSENVFRHACDFRHLGRAKVLAVKDQIAGYDLPTRVVVNDQDVVADTKDLWATMSEVDLVIGATDGVRTRRLVNYLAVRCRTPLIIAAAFQNASIGEIIRVRPGESACYECTRLVLSAAGSLQLLPDADESATHIPYGRELEPGEEARLVNQGSRADVAMVAALQSRVAITTLLSTEMDDDPLPTDYLTWGMRKFTDLAGPFNFEHPFSTNWVHLERQDACPVCRDIGRPVDEKADRAYQEIMASFGEASA